MVRSDFTLIGPEQRNRSAFPSLRGAVVIYSFYMLSEEDHGGIMG